MAVSSEGLVELVLGKEDLKPVGGVWWRGDLKSDCDDRDFNMDEPTMEEKHSSLDMLNDERLDSRAIPEPVATVELLAYFVQASPTCRRSCIITIGLSIYKG
ncbi:unnamed protein product [Musa acuminata subsp. malaccensis]|uniref:(wild Malaysian banana) hypothetical protein n=1 Tax=Musa acuminata subsp. malaccensis TaxID=214687 RepID=A0A8D7A823_MUSAM|nr:unnamed protein product [Musa acuminata subsp. malaccensis]